MRRLLLLSLIVGATALADEPILLNTKSHKVTTPTTIDFSTATVLGLPTGAGTVTSVGLAAPSSIFSVSGSPVTSSGMLTLALANQNAGLIFAGPVGAAIGAPPTFRSLTLTDFPALSATSKLLGSSAASTGISEITLGTNLSMTGTTLNATGGGGTPGGSNTQVQFNDSGAFNGDAAFTWDKTNKQILAGSGTVAHPTYGFSLNTGTGWCAEAASAAYMMASFGGNPALAIVPAIDVRLANNVALNWSSTSSAIGSPDTGLARTAAGAVEINNGTAGQYRDLTLRQATFDMSSSDTLYSTIKSNSGTNSFLSAPDGYGLFSNNIVYNTGAGWTYNQNGGASALVLTTSGVTYNIFSSGSAGGHPSGANIKTFTIDTNGTLQLPLETSAPASPAEGWLYADSTAHTIYYRTNSAWVDLAAGGGGTITLNAGASTGYTAPGAMSLGSTYTFGSTNDNLQYKDLGLGTAAPTSGGQISTALGANNITGLVIKRNTDTAATGNFETFNNAALVPLWNVDITGTLTSGTVGAARLSGTLAAAQFPALTGDVTTTAGSLATTIARIKASGSTAQQTGFAADTYLAGSAVTITAGSPVAGSNYHCVFDMAKTAFGTAAVVISVRMGTAATTSDTAVQTITWSAQTGAVDAGSYDVYVNFRTVGSGTSATVASVGRLTHKSAGTGLSTVVGFEQISNSASAGFDSTTPTKIGLSYNGGASFAGTCNVVQAEYQQ